MGNAASEPGGGVPRAWGKRVAIATEIDAVSRELSAAYAAGDAATAASFYTEDAIFLAPNMDAVSGREAIQEFMQDALDMGLNGVKLRMQELEVFVDTAVEIGTYEIQEEDGTMVDEGKFMAVWKKIDGAWLIHRDITNSSLPASDED